MLFIQFFLPFILTTSFSLSLYPSFSSLDLDSPLHSLCPQLFLENFIPRLLNPFSFVISPLFLFFPFSFPSQPSLPFLPFSSSGESASPLFFTLDFYFLPSLRRKPWQNAFVGNSSKTTTRKKTYSSFNLSWIMMD